MARRKRQGPAIGGVVGGHSEQRLRRLERNPLRRSRGEPPAPRPERGRVLSILKLPFTLWGKRGGPQTAVSVSRRNAERRRRREMEAGEEKPYVEPPRRPLPGGKGSN